MTQQPGPGLYNTYLPATLALPSPAAHASSAARLSALGPCRHENVTSTPVASLALLSATCSSSLYGTPSSPLDHALDHALSTPRLFFNLCISHLTSPHLTLLSQPKLS
ncbi:hypothetical protein J3458_017272 [Metarhizium acridum]|uniref:uncharacterized protein n=1 Tax=Metarhizium acridum TaxID=92637 RepID=UPI001C6BDE57|nr:hypothetical protein J3458_017272 [Metarhizium acridum]